MNRMARTVKAAAGRVESALPESPLVIQMPHTAGAVTWGHALPGDLAVRGGHSAPLINDISVRLLGIFGA